MSLRDQQRAEAKLDSRRFAKQIVCRIVHGPLLSLVERKGLIPKTILLNNETGLDPINNKMLVIPVSKFAEINTLSQEFTTATQQPPDNSEDIEFLEKLQRMDEEIINALRQNLILVTLSTAKPEGKLAGVVASAYDVIIDSTDVNQAIEANYVFRNIRDLREIDKKWTR